MPIIDTNRLSLTPYRPEDAVRMTALHGDPVVMDFMKDSRPLPTDEATAEFERYLAAWKRDGLGIFAVRLRSDDTFIGECGFWYRGDKPGVSMRYLLLAPYWGKGYGTEMAAAVTQWLFTETHVKSFWVVTQARNKASVALLRRLGGQVLETAHMGKDGLWRFEVTRSAWQEGHARVQD